MSFRKNYFFNTYRAVVIVVSLGMLIGLMALVGWIFNVVPLYTFNPNGPTIKVNTAIGIIISGVSLLLLIQKKNIPALILATIVFLLGTISLSEYLFHYDAHIDELFFSGKGMLDKYHGRMARLTTVAFALIGISLFTYPYKRKWTQSLSQATAILLFILSFAGFIGTLYHAGQKFREANIASFSMPLALSGILMSIAILISKPGSGFLSVFYKQTTVAKAGIKGVLIILTLLVLIGWLCLKVEGNGIFDPQMAMVIMIVIFTICFLFVVRSGIQRLNRSEDKLMASEKNLRQVMSSSADVYYVVDRNYKIKLINETAERDLKISWGKPVRLGDNIFDLIPPEKDEPIRKSFEEVFEGKRIEYEIKHDQKDLPGWVSVNYMPVKDDDGIIIGAYVVTKDITERKHFYEALKASEFNNRMVVENKILGVAWASPDGKVMNANNAFCEMLGYSLQEIKGVYFGDFTHPEDVLKEEDLVKKITKGEIDNYLIEKRYRNKKGEYIWVELNLTSYRNSDTGKVDFFIGIVQDIHETKKFEDALKASERNLRQVLSSTGDVYYVIDKNYCITLINTIAEKNLSIAWGKPITLGANILELIPKDSDEPIQESFEKVFTGSRIEYELNHIIENLPSWVLVNYNPVRNENGEITGAYVVTKNITERKKAEEELRQSINRFELISRTTNDAIWEWDLETGKLWGNETHQQLYGLTINDSVPTKAMWLERVHPDERKIMEKRQEEALMSDENVFISEYRFKTNDQRDHIYIYDRCYIVRNDRGKPIRMMGSMIDVTERKKIEDELRRSEERYRSLIEQASDYIMITDDKGNFTDANSSLCKTFGFTREELLGMNINNIIDKEQLKTEPIRFDLLLTGQSVLRERRMISKDGTIIEVEANVKMLPDGRVLAIARDIKERKKAEEQIKREKALSDSLIESLPGLFYLINQDGKYLRWNKLKETITGFTHEEINRMYSVDFFAGDEKEFVRNKIIEGFKNGYTEAEAHIVTKKGERILFYFTGITVEYEGKICLMGTGIDISDRKKAEKELEQSYKAIRELTEHLQNIREEERIHIAREIHDELGQQLTVLKMDASWLSKRLASTDDTIRKKLDSLMELLDDTVKTIRRISSELRPSLLDDMGLVAAMEWHLKEFEKRSNIKTKFKIPDEELLLPGTVNTGLFRIFQESLTNVARHAAAKKVGVKLKKENNSIVLSIDDDGKGFEQEKVINKKTLGILGMRERTFMMGGSYKIDSKPGKGTLVTVAVPYNEQQNA